MGCTYLVLNKVNGKPYVGKTIGLLEDRRQQHEGDTSRDSKLRFHNALRKHGSDSFAWFPLCYSNDDTVLCKAEQESIRFFSSLSPDGYNLTEGGESGILDPEVRERISKTLEGHFVSEETRDKIRGSLQGRKNPEHNERMRGRIQTSESNAKRSASLTGKPKSAEALVNISQAAKNRSPEAQERSMSGLREWNKHCSEVGFTEGHKLNLSKSHTGKKQSEETKAKKNTKLRGQTRSEETKANMRAAWVKRKERESRTLPS